MNQDQELYYQTGLDTLQAQLEETQTRLDAMIARVHTFADQLLAWGYEDAAAELRREILDGPVETDQEYQTLLATRAALTLRIAERERLRAIVVAGVAGNFDKGEAERVLGEV